MNGLEKIHAYWFDGWDEAKGIAPGHPCYVRWFGLTPGIDEEIREQFAGDLERARAGEYDHLIGSPRGDLSLVILLDQFGRHIFRGRAEAFASDEKAFAIARACIAARRDEELSLIERVFLYLPIQHSERLADHELAFERFRAIATLARQRGPAVARFFEQSIAEEQEHFDTLQRFGRYPYRNKALGRESTPAELEYCARKK